jgi:hypothetical protein
MYSKPSALIVSTMKSEPARPPVSGSASVVDDSGAAVDAAGVADCAATPAGAAMAALTAAARRMNSRRGYEKRDRRVIARPE